MLTALRRGDEAMLTLDQRRGSSSRRSSTSDVRADEADSALRTPSLVESHVASRLGSPPVLSSLGPGQNRLVASSQEHFPWSHV